MLECFHGDFPFTGLECPHIQAAAAWLCRVPTETCGNPPVSPLGDNAVESNSPEGGAPLVNAQNDAAFNLPLFQTVQDGNGFVNVLDGDARVDLPSRVEVNGLLQVLARADNRTADSQAAKHHVENVDLKSARGRPTSTMVPSRRVILIAWEKAVG